jgi:FecR-like protein
VFAETWEALRLRQEAPCTPAINSLPNQREAFRSAQAPRDFCWRVALSPPSRDEAPLAATLIAGTATFSTSAARAFTLHFANAAIRANTDLPTVGQVSVVNSRELLVKSTRGSLAFSAGGETRLVAEGAAYRVILDPTARELATASHEKANASQSGAQRAGEISRVIPDVTVGREGKTIAVAANFVVDWQDQINTQTNARARVGLDDGSVLNVGSDSLMRVVKHDSTSQQTELELTYGKLRSRAQKISKPVGKFEVSTAAGVAGVVGTDFYVDYADDTMNVIVFAGVVRVCNLAGVCVLVKAGEMTRLKKNDRSAPPPPIPASLAAMTSASTDTEIGPESGGLSAGSEERGQKQKASRPPVSAGTSKFVWYAVAVVAAATIIAVHASYESPDRP